MEVILKKAKLTVSIIKQLQFASIKQISTFHSLGYVNYKGDKIILLYDDATKTLCFSRFYENKIIKEFNQIDAHGTREEQWKVKMSSNERYSDFPSSWTNNESEANEFLKQVQTRQKEALEIGQIYF